MLESYSLLNKTVDRFWSPVSSFVHNRFKLTPNQISVMGFVAGIAAACALAMDRIGIGMALMVVSQFLDGLDGTIARKFGLQTPLGERLEIVFDRSVEGLMFLALAYAGKVSYAEAVLAFVAILLLTSLVKRSGIDLGFKRVVLYLGYFIGFELAVQLAFWVNLSGFVLSLIVIDYRVQKDDDRKALALREATIDPPGTHESHSS
jgi:phosphatidylglycerophosphate synthase